MGEFIRKLIRWIIFIILVVLLILLIIKLVNNNGIKKKTTKVMDTSVETKKNITKSTKKSTKKNKTTTEKNKTIKKTIKTTKKEDSTTTATLEVEAPDTSSDSYLYILGIMALSSGTYYIYKNRRLNN